ncbi:hypothetical protein [Halomicrobium katesii]|uniref:hypothetical protein n=1 Tax=Halomicrobium katesii TaxID=437163 RepID=UPI00035D024C|nr:hypothetical protein [Halomicrobium katesii]
MVTRRSLVATLGLSALAGCSKLAKTGAKVGDDAAEAAQTETPSETPVEGIDMDDLGTVPKDGDASMEIVAVDHTEPRIVSSDHVPDASGGDTFELTLQNTGVEGDIRVTMWWLPEGTSADEDEIPDSRLGRIAVGFREHRQKTVFFDADERRTVEVTGEPPSDADGYYFTADIATRTVRIRNDGSPGEVTVRLQSKAAERTTFDEKTVFVGEGRETVVEFAAHYPNISDEWEFVLETPGEEG